MSDAAVAKRTPEPMIVGRYALFDELAAGGMATVHLGRLLGPVGFGRTVAVKRLHSHFTTDPDFTTMFMDEARIVARIRHPNVVPMVDVVESSKGLFLVMEYVHGESFSKLVRVARAGGRAMPLPIVASIMHGVLMGLHAAHETRGATGELLEVVHRDVSPQNVIVGVDGAARVLDFGVAKAVGRAQVTREGQIKGKLAYMAPEQIRGQADRRADVFAASVVLWEALTNHRLHEGLKDVEIVSRIVTGGFVPPSSLNPEIPPVLDQIVMRGLESDPKRRWPTARDMAVELERSVPMASPREVGDWVERHAHDVLAMRASKVGAMEAAATRLAPYDSTPPSAQGGASAEDAVHSAVVPLDMAQIEHAVGSSRSNVLTQGSSHGTAMPMPGPDEIEIGPWTLLVAVCAFLAVVGASLGGFAIYKRATMSASSTIAPRSAAPLPSHAPTPIPKLEAAPEPIPSGEAAPAHSVVTPPPGTTARPPTTAAATRPTVQPSAASPSPSNAKNCDPPFTVDESGHKKYKLDCLTE